MHGSRSAKAGVNKGPIPKGWLWQYQGHPPRHLEGKNAEGP